MAGNKALQKFKESKIPKKGKAKTIIEIPIYSEPNTHSTIIGRIKKSQEITWISKSICDDREWIRLNQDNNYGYIVGYESDQKCNLEIGTIKETKEETKKEYGFDQKLEVIPITKEEIKLGNEALEEILNDDDDKKDDDTDNNSKTNISTENDESLKSDLSEINYGNDDKLEINLGQEWDNMFNDDINKINEINYEYNKLKNEIKSKIKQDKDKDKDKNNKKDKDKDNSVSEIICSLKEGLPENEKSKIDDMLKELNEIHEASQKEIERRKNEKKKNEKGKKTNKDNSKKSDDDDDTIEINGVKKPLDHSKQIGNLYPVFVNAKTNYNIPKNQPPDYWVENYDRNGHYQEGRIYVYFKQVDGIKVMLEFRNDRAGHEFEKGYTIPGHLNGPLGEHYFHNGLGEFTNFKDNDPDKNKIKHKTKEEHEKLKKQYLEGKEDLIKKLYRGNK